MGMGLLIPMLTSSIHKVAMTSFAITLHPYGQCCWRHVVWAGNSKRHWRSS